MRRATPALALAGLAAACTGGGGGGGSATFDVRPVVGPALAGFASVPDPRPSAPAPELVERVRGLLVFLGAPSDPLRASARAELETLGPDAVGPLGGALADPRVGAEERIAAAEALSAGGGVQAAEALLRQAEESPETWVRALCAEQLGRMPAAWVVPRLLARLGHEAHEEARLAVADALARHANYAGIAVLERVAATGRDSEASALAAARLDELARATGSRDGADLRRRWEAGESTLLAAEPARSLRYEREVWRRIADLGADEPRTVDEARYVAARLGPTGARFLALALHDESRYVRVHAARSLAEMGPRAAAAGPELVAALADPELAPHAAAALGRVRAPGAARELRARLGGTHPLELRVACTRALGPLGDPSAAGELEAVLGTPTAPAELRQGAAESLLYLDAEELRGDALAAGAERPWPADELEVLAAALVTAGLEVEPTERAVRWWLAARAQAGDARARAALARWDRPPGPPGVRPDREALRTWREARAALLRELGP